MLTFDSILGQQAAISVLRGAYLADRLSHGLIFTGPVGVGKGTTALTLAGLFLCEHPVAATPCGTCASCRVFDGGNHPDLHRIYRQLVRIEKKDAKARDIAVGVIRDYLVAPASMKSAMARGKVFIIEEAELMNAQAQNSMLKTLEEPAGRTLIILLTDQPGALLPTIRSRCQLIRFAAMPAELIASELARRGIEPGLAHRAASLTGGSLGAALRWIEDDIVAPALDLAQQFDGLLAGRAALDLPAWFKKAADAYADRQLQRDELASKDQATREGLNLYLHIAAEHVRRMMPALAADPVRLEHVCGMIDALTRAENYLDSNVTVSLVLQQLAVAVAA